MLELGFAGFLLAHAGVHASFLAPHPPAKKGAPAWPFDTNRSWLLSPLGAGRNSLRVLVVALVAVIIAGYAIAALGLLGIVSGDVTMASVALASTASLGLLGLFFHPWLTIGLIIDVVLLWIALTRPISV